MSMYRAARLVSLLAALGCGDASPDADASKGDAGGEQDGKGEQVGGTCDSSARVKEGDGTYYAADGSGNCSFPASPSDLMVAAMNQSDYANSAVCGACVEITGPLGSTRVRIVDRCPECAPGDLDLSKEAFARVAKVADGRVAIQWRYVACDVSGGVVYHFKDGSNAWWLAVQVRNHRLPIAKFEARNGGGQYQTLSRVDYNYFVADKGLGGGPFTFRITDVEGRTIESADIPLLEDKDQPTEQQFPACP